eukprot:COSAG01_NODE_1717_length_9398_cov_83.738574_2_plen_54_part_00
MQQPASSCSGAVLPKKLLYCITTWYCLKNYTGEYATAQTQQATVQISTMYMYA